LREGMMGWKFRRKLVKKKTLGGQLRENAIDLSDPKLEDDT